MENAESVICAIHEHLPTWIEAGMTTLPMSTSFIREGTFVKSFTIVLHGWRRPRPCTSYDSVKMRGNVDKAVCNAKNLTFPCCNSGEQ